MIRARWDPAVADAPRDEPVGSNRRDAVISLASSVGRGTAIAMATAVCVAADEA
jgi:hypothetical protein